MDEKERFIKEREEKYNGEIRFMTYATLIGSAGSKKTADRGGILYAIGDILHFEDFEKHNALLAMMGRKEDYSKTEMSIGLDEITVAKEVRPKDANICIFGLADEEKISPSPGGIAGFFIKPVIQFLLKDRPSLFFDFLDKEGVLKLVNEHMMKPE